MKSPIHFIISFITITTIGIHHNNIEATPLINNDVEQNQQLNEVRQQQEYKIKLNRNDLNFEKNLIQFQQQKQDQQTSNNKALKCFYEIKNLCTKLKNSENFECSSNKFKFLPFYLFSNRLSTKANKINFESVDKFALIINGNCIEARHGDEATQSSSNDRNDIKALNLNLKSASNNEIKLTIEIINEDLVKNLEVNIISSSNDYEIIFDNGTNVYQLYVNNTNYLNSNTILAYLILNIVDYEDYKLKFQIIPINDNKLELDFDEMKSGLYSIKSVNSFNSTIYSHLSLFTFNYDFLIFVNDQPNIIKKFQIKFNENLNSQQFAEHQVRIVSLTTESDASAASLTTRILHVENETAQNAAFTKSSSSLSYSFNFYNMVAIIIFVTVAIFSIIVFIFFCLLFVYLCRKYKKNKSNGDDMVKVKSDAKIATITASSTSSSTHDINAFDSSTESSCISAKGISTYNLSQANIRYEKPMKSYQKQQQQQSDTLSISPITTATTVTNNTNLSNSSSLLAVANQHIENNHCYQARSSISTANSDYEFSLPHQQKYLNNVYLKAKLNYPLQSTSENYGFYSLKNPNVIQKDEKIYVKNICNLKSDNAQISSV